jgi:hypothetical protein
MIRRLTVLAVVAVVAAIGLGLVATVATADGVGGYAPRAAAGACSPAAGCATIAAACANGSCPTVHVSPAGNVAQDQWVTVTLSGFAPGDDVTAYYCSDKQQLSAARSDPCVLSSTPSLLYPAQQVPIAANGTGTAAVNVEGEPPGGGDTPLAGRVPGGDGSVQSFFCDNSANRCSIDVVDSSLSPSGSPTPAPATTAVVPLRFLPASTGCPDGKIVTTSSDYSIEDLLPALATSLCSGKDAALAINTSTDLDQAAKGLAGGTDQVLFTTDPTAPDVEKILQASGHSYADIPVAATATVLAFSASQEDQSSGQLIYADNSYRLTPAQVAGLVTYNWSGPSGADPVACPSGSGTCPGLQLLNAENGFVPAQAYGAFDPSEHTGVTDQLLHWLCGAPRVPYVVDGSEISDSNTAAHEITTSSYDSSWPITECSPRDQLPAITSPSATDFALLSDPSQQAKYLRAFAPPPAGQSQPVLGLAPMDASQASFYGFAAAALQNAAGQFVTPTPASISAALSAAAVTDGIVTPSLTKPVSGAYPMPAVVYAVVRTGGGAAGADQGVADLLTALVSHVSTDTLPGGYAAMPSSLQRVATAAIAKDIPAGSTTGSVTQPGGSGGSGGRGGAGGSGVGAGATVVGGGPSLVAGGGGSPVAAPGHGSTEPAAGSTPVVAPATAVSAATAGPAILVASAARWGIPALGLLVLLAGGAAIGLRSQPRLRALVDRIRP